MVKFSFVIPTYNNKKLLKNVLEALNFQNGFGREDYEVIVVDDGSDDGTYGYIKDVGKNYEFKYIYLERLNASCRSRTRNRGWREACGEVVVFLDSDIIVKENYLDELNRCYDLNRDIMVIGTRLILHEDVSHESICDRSIFKKYDSGIRDFSLLEVRHHDFNHYSYNIWAFQYPWLLAFTCNMAVPYKRLQEIGGFDENFMGYGIEDIELGYRLYDKGIKIASNSKLDALHQFHGGFEMGDESKFPDIEKNTGYFYSKHPHAMDLQYSQALDMFKGIMREKIRFGINQEGNLEEKVIDFKEREDLEKIKKDIVELSEEEGVNLIVNDYVEDTDLEIWIQLLGRRKSTPLYYPISKRLDMNGFGKYMEQKGNIVNRPNG